MTPSYRYNHAFDFNVERVLSNKEDASDITGTELKQRFIDAIHAISDDDFLAHANCFDTITLVDEG
jgi:hypothetical protein